mmetsp:Transcript_15725/g.33039  ORF Transcript_15725/g.33039 Transcript_15725/m.33039 type:complete len:260 (-) Transcript_15725:109-888(-)|eukprot:CAMPEP_0171328122 /NCGR_PEP_ID=MMETSP0878-20121228/459_1 /TAXON_ID=67004 /ORGANISM="Thalassiosira weissflogii, Strain CCMP1336" /LENGTH=259 /DNA_ID=CAMNT_0011827951 /DNA_START=31 /DNA_END=810 /DNA_ORIENTATION=+
MASLSIASSGTRSASVQAVASFVARRLLPFSSSTLTSRPIMIASSPSSADSQTRTITSTVGQYHLYQSNNSNKSVPPKNSLSYTSLRNKITEATDLSDDPFEVRPGEQYVSPYAAFFANIEAGRTTLGTTREMEDFTAQIQEQHLECGIPESALRFQTTSYGRYQLPPYVAPAEHRVVVKVPIEAIPFESEMEKEVFLEIVGSRYNKEKGVLQMSSEKFASRIENKRHLVGMIERIVSSAKRLAKEFAAEDQNVMESTN